MPRQKNNIVGGAKRKYKTKKDKNNSKKILLIFITAIVATVGISVATYLVQQSKLKITEELSDHEISALRNKIAELENEDEDEEKIEKSILYVVNKKNIMIEKTVQQEWSNEDNCYNLTIDDINILADNNISSSCGISKLYETNLENIIVIESKVYTGSIWSYIDIDTSNTVQIREDNDNRLGLIVNNEPIEEIVTEQDCNSSSITNEEEAENAEPTFDSYEVQGELAYAVSRPAPMTCDLGCFSMECLEDEVMVKPLIEEFVGLNINMNLIYFSAEGNGWTSSYVYDLAINDISKEDPEDLLELILVKEFY